MDISDRTNKKFRVAQSKLGTNKGLIIYEENLQEAVPLIKLGLHKSSKLLHTNNDVIIDASILNDKFIKNRMEGVSGFCPNPYMLSIRINPKALNWKSHVVGVISHEFSHMVRFQRIVKEKYTILDYLAMEGLAQCFETQITGFVRPYSKALTDKEARIVWRKVKKIMHKSGKDLYRRVFLERKDKVFPHWSGYTISYLILNERLHNMKSSWDEIIGMDAKSLIGDGLL